MISPCITSDQREAILVQLARQVVALYGLRVAPETLLQNEKLLHAYVMRAPINWKQIAAEVGEDRHRVYHWYRETYSRRILGVKMTDEDRLIIRAMIIQGVRDRSILSSNFYDRVHERFGHKYPCQELRMTYNNALRTKTVRGILKECRVSLPPRRTLYKKDRPRSGALDPVETQIMLAMLQQASTASGGTPAASPVAAPLPSPGAVVSILGSPAAAPLVSVPVQALAGPTDVVLLNVPQGLLVGAPGFVSPQLAQPGVQLCIAQMPSPQVPQTAYLPLLISSAGQPYFSAT